MKRFQFRLSTVERIRKDEERRALQGVGASRQRLDQAKKFKLKLQIARNQALSRQERLSVKGARVEEFFIEDRFIRGQEKRIEHAELSIQKAIRALEKSVRIYQFTRRRLMQIEKLHEKARVEFERALKRHEEKELRDLLVMRANWFGIQNEFNESTEEVA